MAVGGQKERSESVRRYPEIPAVDPRRRNTNRCNGEVMADGVKLQLRTPLHHSGGHSSCALVSSPKFDTNNDIADKSKCDAVEKSGDRAEQRRQED